MSRIQPIDPAAATGKTRELFDSIKGALGGVPNVFRVTGQSPAALGALWGVFGAMNSASIPASLREQIALSVGETNGCDYCVAAHSVLGKHAGLRDADVQAARHGNAADPKAAAALAFASAVLEHKGHVRDADLAAVRAAGYSDAQVMEIVAAVVQNVFTNWVNHVAQTPVDFPAAPALAGVA
ncbi:MAG: carboxymuconolactone decarboxylase family protein [Phycisphaerales bacterium]